MSMNRGVPNLELIEERFWNEIKSKNEYKNNKYRPEFSLYVYPQWWGSTTLGFEGIGGQALTRAYTTVIEDEKTKWTGVFFDERLAYCIHNPNECFWDDLNMKRMASVSFSYKYTE